MSPAESSRRTPLLYAPDAGRESTPGEVHLSGEEARHVRALRLDPGSHVRITDGLGGLWDAVLRSTADDRVSCEVREPIDVAPRLPLELAFGVANKSRTLWLVEKATELGARALWPVEFERSRSVADAARSSSFWRKARRRAVSAMKQSGSGWLPRIESRLTVSRFLDLADVAAAPLSGRPVVPRARIILDAGGEPLARCLCSWDGSSPLIMLVGPEGGLTEGERDALAERGFRAAALGRLTLRFETAAIAGLALGAHHLVTERP